MVRISCEIKIGNLTLFSRSFESMQLVRMERAYLRVDIKTITYATNQRLDIWPINGGDKPPCRSIISASRGLIFLPVAIQLIVARFWETEPESRASRIHRVVDQLALAQGERSFNSPTDRSHASSPRENRIFRIRC